MNVFQSLSEAHSHGNIHSLALGFFDGVHLGHQRVISNSMAGFDSNRCCVLTFKSHPQSVLFPDQAPPLLTGLPHKLKVLADYGVRNVLTLPFDRQTMQISAENFLKNLRDALPGLMRVSVGPNWRFGHKRRGTIAMLLEWARECRIETALTEPASHQDSIISSSRIREQVRAGNMTGACAMLGRPFSLYGEVAQGRQLGRSLGFPTLNLQTKDQCLPPHGVYTGLVEFANSIKRPAAINIGLRPTVENSPVTVIEAHILDFTESIYGQSVAILPLNFLRKEKKFPSTDALQSQLSKDVMAARAWAGSHFTAETLRSQSK